MNERIRVRFEKLEAIRRDIEARIDGVAVERLNRQPAPGHWSAAQAISHIVLSESRTLAYVGKKASDPSQLRPAGVKERLKGWLITAIMRVPIRFKAPEAVASVPDNEDPAELRARWAHVRGDFRALLDTIPDSALGMCLFRHPVAGATTLPAALDFMIAHASRHAKQIERALR